MIFNQCSFLDLFFAGIDFEEEVESENSRINIIAGNPMLSIC